MFFSGSVPACLSLCAPVVSGACWRADIDGKPAPIKHYDDHVNGEGISLH